MTTATALPTTTLTKRGPESDISDIADKVFDNIRISSD